MLPVIRLLPRHLRREKVRRLFPPNEVILITTGLTAAFEVTVEH